MLFTEQQKLLLQDIGDDSMQSSSGIHKQKGSHEVTKLTNALQGRPLNIQH